jgi:hypothetical protein
MNKKPKGWYEAIAIRPVMHVDGYEHYEKVCGHVADIFFSVDEQKLRQKLITNSKESINITLYTLYKAGEAKCPAYWVSKELLTALMQSELSIEIESLNWAMKTGIFMLPKGVVFSPEKRSIYTIFWHYDAADKFLCWAATDGDSFFCRQHKVGDNLRKFTYADVEDLNPQLVTDFNEYLQAIFLRLILLMECRPELVEAEAQVVRVNKGFAKDKAKDFYEPLWIGRNYAIKKDVQDKGGTHASPRVHWRRGYLRNQPYGEGKQQRKLVWIEPVLVMGRS